MKKGLFYFNVREIAEVAIMSALAVVLDRFVRIPVGATGGSINISTLPLFLVALRHGWFKGLLAALVYSLLTCLFDGYGMQFFVFDYLIAFGSIAIGGLFSKLIFSLYNKKKGYIVLAFALIVLVVGIHFIIRTLSATVDSMIFYEYPFMAGFLYNVNYVSLSCLGVLVLLCALLPLITVINKLFPTSFLKEDLEEDSEEDEN